MATAPEGSEGEGIVGDCGVGTIVWVRRRNGSWWPGRILGHEELAESHLMSPRSGTPVKLLGREDASVDWYNLEKSKRVKPFRCGEFDACIERAEASHSTPIKKREKYARREDAIIHALELEKHLERKHESTTISYHASNKTSGLSERESTKVHVWNKLANQNSQTSSRKMSSLLDEYYLDHPLPSHRNRKVKPSISEADKHEIAEDVSSDIVKLKGKLFLSVTGGNSDITYENHTDLLPYGHNSEFESQAGIDKNFHVKRKTLLTGAVNDSPVKRRDRRRPLIKVLQNSSKLLASYSIQPHHDISGNLMPVEEHHMVIAHDAENNNTMNPSPNADDHLDYSRHSWKHTPLDADNAYNESTPSAWSEENDFDSSATDSELEMVGEKLRPGITEPMKLISESCIEGGMSQWYLKGKRNNRIIVKRLNPLGHEFSSEKEIDYDTEDDDIFTRLGNDLERQHSDYVDSDDDLQLISQSGWGGVWGEPEDNIDRFYTYPFIRRMTPLLIDVDLKVQARYHGEHVPFVSLMSKLNGKAITGHPLRIEVLEDGSTDLLLPRNDFSPDGDAAPPPTPNWTTAKRTCMHRLPRPNPDPPNYTKSRSPLLKKSFYHTHRSASGRFQRKPLRTGSLFSSQKTRALSSFVSEKRNNTGVVFFDGLIKPDGSMPPVTCVPIKVVFSRIMESVGRPPSAVAHRAI